MIDSLDRGDHSSLLFRMNNLVTAYMLDHQMRSKEFDDKRVILLHL